MAELNEQQRADVENEMRQGRMVHAINAYRKYSGVGLAEAKQAVEAMAKEMGVETPKSGCGTSAAIFFALVGVALYAALRT